MDGYGTPFELYKYTHDILEARPLITSGFVSSPNIFVAVHANNSHLNRMSSPIKSEKQKTKT